MTMLEQVQTYILLSLLSTHSVSASAEDVGSKQRSDGTHNVQVSGNGNDTKNTTEKKVENKATNTTNVYISVPPILGPTTSPERGSNWPESSSSRASTTSGDRSRTHTDSPLIPLGSVALATGLAMVATGVVFTVLAAGSYSSAERSCPAHTGCDPTALEERSKASREALIATLGFAVGVPVGTVGVIAIVFSPSKSAHRGDVSTVDHRHLALNLAGHF